MPLKSISSSNPPKIKKMGTRSKKINGDGGTSSAIPSTADHRPWPDLPQDLLIHIFNFLLVSIADRLCFPAVCRSFNSAAAAAAAAPAVAPFSSPPLLLRPLGLTLHSLPDPKPYKSPLQHQTHLTGDCVGSSFGHLIFHADKTITLADVFTGRKIELKPPYPHKFRSRIGILTAPPSAPSSTLVLVGLSFTVFCRLSSNKWVRVGNLRYGAQIISLALVDGLVYCLGSDYKVKVVDFRGPVSCGAIETAAFPYIPSSRGNFRRFLVGCGEEVLLLLFVRSGKNRCQVAVYRLDSEKEKERWVEKENLGDWCLFIDVMSNSRIACSDPARWGGRSNCVYVVGPGCDTFSVLPLDGPEIKRVDAESPLCLAYKKLAVWPSPVWVYPNRSI